MSEEKTKKKVKNKITSFHAYRDEPENPKMDEFLRESIMKEADELEERLNSDPKLAGISASDDMFDMIVGRLKAEGYWEEDDEDEDANTDYAEAEERRLDDASLEDEEKPPERNTAEYQDMQPEKVTAERDEEKLAKLYEEQPEEVLRLMEKGRKAEQEEKERTRRRVRRNKYVRRAAAVAAAFVLLVSAGFSTEASRGWILKMWDAAMEGFGFKAKTNYLSNGVETRIRSEEEQDALNAIKESLKVGVLDFVYLPSNMEFLEYEIEKDEWFAKLFYEYNEKIISVRMIKLGDEGVSYYTLDQDAILRDTVKNSQNIEMEIWETNVELNRNTYAVEFEFEECRYVINGVISLEELKKILKFAIIL